MVLNDNRKKERFQDIKDHYYNYVVVDVERLGMDEETVKIEHSNEILAVITKVFIANEIFKVLSPERIIKIEILYKAIKCIYDENPFNDEELKEYFMVTEAIEDFNYLTRKIIENDHCIDYDIQLMLFGLTDDDQYHLRQIKDSMDKVFESYSTLKYKYLIKQENLILFIKEAKKLVSDAHSKLKEFKKTSTIINRN